MFQQQGYIAVLERMLEMGRGGVGPGGATFKRSVQKADEDLMFLAVNLHTQEMRVRELAGGRTVAVALENECWDWLPSQRSLSMYTPRGAAVPAAERTSRPPSGGGGVPPSPAAAARRPDASATPLGASDGSSDAAAAASAVSDGAGSAPPAGFGGSPAPDVQQGDGGAARRNQVIYETVTVGAFAATPLGFKAGGLRQMLAAYSVASSARRGSVLSLNSDHRARQDLLWEIERRMDVVVCQAATALVTAFARKVRLIQRYMPPADGRRLLEQYARTGFLFAAESLLSTAGKEIGMLGDFDVGVRMLDAFAFRLRPPTARSPSGAVSISREEGLVVVELHVWPSADVVIVKATADAATAAAAAPAATSDPAPAPSQSGEPAPPQPAAAAAVVAPVHVPEWKQHAGGAGAAALSSGGGGGGTAAVRSVVAGGGSGGLATAATTAAHRASVVAPPSPAAARPRYRDWMAMADREHHVGRLSFGAMAGAPSLSGAAGSSGEGSSEDDEPPLHQQWDEGQAAVIPESLRDGGLIRVAPVLFSQGINEMQTVANLGLAAGVELQEAINEENLGRLRVYCNKYKAYVVAETTEALAAARAAPGATPALLLEAQAACARRRERTRSVDVLLTRIGVRARVRSRVWRRVCCVWARGGGGRCHACI